MGTAPSVVEAEEDAGEDRIPSPTPSAEARLAATAACTVRSDANISEQLGQSKISEFRRALNHADGLDPELRDGLFALLATPNSAAAPARENISLDDATNALVANA